MKSVAWDPVAGDGSEFLVLLLNGSRFLTVDEPPQESLSPVLVMVASACGTLGHLVGRQTLRLDMLCL